MDVARVNGADIEYEVVGEGEPAICIHGSLIAESFRPMLQSPGIVGKYRLIHYHRRGYMGSSRIASATSISEQARDCLELLHYLGFEQAHVVGHSYGGAIALQLASDSPQSVRSLALLEPAIISGASSSQYRDSLADGLRQYRDGDSAVVVDKFLQARWPGYRETLDRILPEAFAQAVADAETSFEHEFPALLEWQFGEAEILRIAVPTLSVLGGRSEAIWPRFGETHRLLLSHVPQVEGVEFPGATHFLQMEDPDGMVDILTQFWASYPVE